jgi:hypothetical protein
MTIHCSLEVAVRIPEWVMCILAEKGYIKESKLQRYKRDDCATILEGRQRFMTFCFKKPQILN